ncbi:EamA family transporter [Brevibacillus sp. TJ4]|uniref:EamA family transporter n=1 Tax=Brevibacillus sp. TJ4 TaxID=3234853 RepID=UPI0037D1DD18
MIKNWRYVLLVLFGACSYGILSLAMKRGFAAGFTPGELSSGQLWFGGIIMASFAFFLSRESIRIRHLLLLAPVSLVMALASVLYHQAVSEVSASLAIVLFFQFTWFGVFLESISTRKWPDRATWISLVMLSGGTFFASGLGESGLQDVSLTGLASGLLAGFSFATVIFLNGRLAPAMNPFLRSAVSIGMAAIMLSFVYPPSYLWNGRLLEGMLPYALLVAFFGSVIPIYCLAVSVPRLGNGLVTMLSAMELPAVVLIASFVLHEPVSITQWGGVLMILAAIAVPQIAWSRLLPSSQGRQSSNVHD